MKKKSRWQGKHMHFAHGWCWGVAALSIALLLYIGVDEGYVQQWLGQDFEIVNAHESVQSQDEQDKLERVMRRTGIQSVVLTGIPNEALYYNGEVGFTGYDKNNDAILAMQATDPEKFMAFCTFDPANPDHMETIEDCVDRGAKGFKLYSGHGFFYNEELPLNDESLEETYAYLESQALPLIFHVNAGKYQEEFESVLTNHPDLTVICPHFCLSSKNLQRLSYLFDTYPNLYSDLSWGNQQYFLDGIERMSANVETYQQFITKYQNRFLFGTDIVITDYEGKEEAILTNLIEVYRNLLEQKKFAVYFAPNPTDPYNGLDLEYEVLLQIYENNWKRVMGEEVKDKGGLEAFLLGVFQ